MYLYNAKLVKNYYQNNQSIQTLDANKITLNNLFNFISYRKLKLIEIIIPLKK